MSGDGNTHSIPRTKGQSSARMITKIWIEPVERPDCRSWYTDRGLLFRTRLGGPDGEVLCDRVHYPLCETCRVLMSRGITGPFETWKKNMAYPCMRGDIERTAGLTVSDPDIHGRDCKPRFKRWKPYPSSQDALRLHS